MRMPADTTTETRRLALTGETVVVEVPVMVTPREARRVMYRWLRERGYSRESARRIADAANGPDLVDDMDAPTVAVRDLREALRLNCRPRNAS